MDGNGRWASRRRLPVAAGHRAGTRALRRTVEAAIDLGVESLCVYAFSTENWSRPPHEVDALMGIFVETIERELPDLAREGVRIRFIGRRDRASDAAQARRWTRLEQETARNERLQLWIAFDYGGRAEIVEAARRLVEEGVDPRDIDENAIAARLYAPEMREPDLLIRTSGELRISNFLLWQLAYTELVFVETLWPDFGERQLRDALAEYASRRRRFGGRDELLPDAGRRRGGRPSDRALRRLLRRLVPRRARAARRRLVGLHEFYRLARSLRPLVLAGYGGAVAAVLGAQLGGPTWMLGGFLLVLPLAFVFAAVAETRQSATVAVGTTVLGAAWVGLGLGTLILIRDLEDHGRLALLTVLLTVFVADTFAYIGGRLAGRHRMTPR